MLCALFTIHNALFTIKANGKCVIDEWFEPFEA